MNQRRPALHLVSLALVAALAPAASADEPVRLRLRTDRPFALRTFYEPMEEAEQGLDPEAIVAGRRPAPEVLARLLSEAPKGAPTFTTVLARAKGNDGLLRVRMIGADGEVLGKAAPRGTDKNGARRMAGQMAGTVQLRGDITPAGEIDTFYLEGKQKNLLWLMFQLPATPVRPGDSWPLHCSFLTLGGGYVGAEARRESRVSLVELKTGPDGEPVATLDYHHVERVKGKSDTIPGASVLELGAVVAGRGEFLLRSGTWRRLSLRLWLRADSGPGGRGWQKSRIILQSMAEVPAALLSRE